MYSKYFLKVLITVAFCGSVASVTILDSVQNAEDSSSKISVWARKAGGRSKYESITTKIPETKHTEVKDDTAYNDSPEELDCPDNKFYHLRGKLCVPIVCSRRKPFRDPETGKCMQNPEMIKGYFSSASNKKGYVSRSQPKPNSYHRGLGGIRGGKKG